MVDVPTPTPVTTPVVGLTVATPVLPLTHVPPVIDEVREVVSPLHNDSVPEIAGTGLTVAIVTEVAEQELASVTVSE